MRHPLCFPSWSAVIFFCIFWLPACNRPITYPALFAVADSLASVTPDSAVTMLASWKEEMKNKPEPLRNYYQLLRIKADDNARIAHTSDSLVKSLIRYYEGDGDKRLLPETYYYAGRVLRDMADAPQAIKYFERALEATSGEGHLSLQSKIYCQMGGIFEFQNLLSLSLEMARKAYECDTRLDARGNMVHDLDNMAGLHWKCLRPDSAEFYYKAAVSLAETLNDTLQASLIKRHLGHLYIELGRYKEVEEQLRPCLNHHNECDRYGTYSMTAKYFLTIGQYDSARFYYERSFSGGDIYVKKSAYWGFAQIAFAQNKLEEGQRNLARYDLCLDSILKITSTQAVGQRHFGYNYELQEKENRLLKEDNAGKQRYFTIILAIFGISLACAATYMIHHRRKRKIFTAIETRYTPDTGTLPIPPLPAEAPTPGQTIKQTGVTPETGVSPNQTEPVDPQHEDGTASRSGNAISPQQNQTTELQLSELRLYLLGKTDKGDQLTEEDWSIVENTMRTNHPDFIIKLCDACQCSILEFRVSMLVKLNIPPATIAGFIGRSKESVSSIRRRLYEKAFAEKGTARKWDEFIQEL